jgi:hypothetical protein
MLNNLKLGIRIRIIKLKYLIILIINIRFLIIRIKLLIKR